MSTKNTMCTSPICRYPFQRHKSSNISSNWWDLRNRWAWNWTNMVSTTETPSCCSTILQMHAQLLFMTTPSFTAIESKWRLLTTSQFLQYLTITIRKRLKFQRSHQLRQNSPQQRPSPKFKILFVYKNSFCLVQLYCSIWSFEINIRITIN